MSNQSVSSPSTLPVAFVSVYRALTMLQSLSDTTNCAKISSSASLLTVSIPSRILRIFSLHNLHTFSKKKFSCQILLFLTNFEAKSVTIRDRNQKKLTSSLLHILSRFQIFYQKSVWMMLYWLLFFGVKNVPKFQPSTSCSLGARVKADVTKCGHDLESSCYALQNGIWIMPIACTRHEI